MQRQRLPHLLVDLQTAPVFPVRILLQYAANAAANILTHFTLLISSLEISVAIVPHFTQIAAAACASRYIRYIQPQSISEDHVFARKYGNAHLKSEVMYHNRYIALTFHSL